MTSLTSFKIEDKEQLMQEKTPARLHNIDAEEMVGLLSVAQLGLHCLDSASSLQRFGQRRIGWFCFEMEWMRRREIQF